MICEVAGVEISISFFDKDVVKLQITAVSKSWIQAQIERRCCRGKGPIDFMVKSWFQVWSRLHPQEELKPCPPPPTPPLPLPDRLTSITLAVTVLVLSFRRYMVLRVWTKECRNPLLYIELLTSHSPNSLAV